MISPDTIQAIRERTDILAVVGESVPSLKRRGRTFSGLCPFHNEKTPSFHVNPDRGFFHCFGCKESGDVLSFVMKHDGYTFHEAVQMLAERLGIVLEEDKRPRTDADRQKKHKEDLYGVNQLAATYFESQLRDHPHASFAIDELDKRGLAPSFSGRPPGKGASEAVVDQALQAFRIGYAPSGWDGLTLFLKAQGISPTLAEATGLLVPRSSGAGHYDRFRHRLMFAVVDAQGRVVAFSGRALADAPGERPRDPADKPAKYINSPESPIYAKGQTLFGLHQAKSAIRTAECAAAEGDHPA
ncbi:DNA primase, partial [bacterium]